MAHDATSHFGIPRLLGDGRYIVDEIIGEGGMAAVFRAWDTRLKMWRAIKLLLPEFHNRKKLRARFEAEAHAMARLEHRHIIRVYDVQAAGSLPYIVMELAEGGSIVDWTNKFGAMPAQLASTVTIQVCKALTAAHAEGLVHRDIKPHNILINRQGLCKITDFGIAHIAEDNRTKTGSSMGTLGYMAPEQQRDSKDVDERADVYAAGATLYHLLTLESPNDLFLAEHQPSMLAGVPEPLRQAILSSTRWNRDDRCKSPHELGLSLFAARKLLAEDPTSTPPISVLCKPPPPPPDPNAPPRQWRAGGMGNDESVGEDSYASEAGQFAGLSLAGNLSRPLQVGSIEDEAPTAIATSSSARSRRTDSRGDDSHSDDSHGDEGRSHRQRPAARGDATITGNRTPHSFDRPASDRSGGILGSSTGSSPQSSEDGAPRRSTSTFGGMYGRSGSPDSAPNDLKPPAPSQPGHSGPFARPGSNPFSSPTSLGAPSNLGTRPGVGATSGTSGRFGEASPTGNPGQAGVPQQRSASQQAGGSGGFSTYERSMPPAASPGRAPRAPTPVPAPLSGPSGGEPGGASRAQQIMGGANRSAKPAYLADDVYDGAYGGAQQATAPSSAPTPAPMQARLPARKGISAEHLQVIALGVGALMLLVVGAVGLSLLLGRAAVVRQATQAEAARAEIARALDAEPRLVEDLIAAGAAREKLETTYFKYHDARGSAAQHAAAIALINALEPLATTPPPDEARAKAGRLPERVTSIVSARQTWLTEVREWDEAATSFPGSLAVRLGIASPPPQ